MYAGAVPPTTLTRNTVYVRVKDVSLQLKCCSVRYDGLGHGRAVRLQLHSLHRFKGERRGRPPAGRAPYSTNHTGA